MKKALVTVAMLVLLSGALLASGGSSVPTPRTADPRDSSDSPEGQRLTPEQEAAIAYNDGLKHQEKADTLRKNAAAELANDKKHDKLEAQSKKEYANALQNFEDATKKNPKMFQAFSGIGYAQRKLGNYDGALAAYNRALEIEPRYSPAIEYRAEAYLGLNRVDDAKSAYTALFAGDRKRADELHAAMKDWLELRRKDPGGVAPETIEEFSKWVARREEVAGQTSALVPPMAGRW